MEKSLQIFLVVAMAGGMAMAGVIEDFNNYAVGSDFTVDQSQWTGASNTWKIEAWGGRGNILTDRSGDDTVLKYGGEQFLPSGSGYTMFFSMYYNYPYGSYAGVKVDMAGDGTGGTRFFVDNGAWIGVWKNYRVYRQGTTLSVWWSDTAFSSSNSGTLLTTLTNVNTAGGYVGLYGVSTSFYDDVAVFQGNVAAIPEPVSLSLLTLGVLPLLRRRRAA